MTLRLFEPKDYPFAQEVINSSNNVFLGWKELPDFDKFVTYVVEGSGLVVCEALGGGEYLGSSAFLPHAKGLLAGKYQLIVMRNMFLETDATTILGVADIDNPSAYSNLRVLGLNAYPLDEFRFGNRMDFIPWALGNKYFAKEVSKWEVDVPYKKMLYAVLKCAENGWGMKGFRQWHIYAKMAKDIPSIIPMNVDFTRFLVGDISIGLDGVW